MQFIFILILSAVSAAPFSTKAVSQQKSAKFQKYVSIRKDHQRRNRAGAYEKPVSTHIQNDYRRVKALGQLAEQFAENKTILDTFAMVTATFLRNNLAI